MCRYRFRFSNPSLPVTVESSALLYTLPCAWCSRVTFELPQAAGPRYSSKSKLNDHVVPWSGFESMSNLFFSIKNREHEYMREIQGENDLELI